MSKKRKKSGTLPSKKARKAFKQVEPVMRPLLELFASVDDVMSEHNAFSESSIHKSLGRIYRQWMDTREALDPGFDRERYRHEMKAGKKKGKSPLGRKPLAEVSPSSSTDRRSISEKSQKKSARSENASASRSAKAAPSDDLASGGRSTKKNRSGYGVASRSAKGKGSVSGSKQRDTTRSPKVKG